MTPNIKNIIILRNQGIPDFVLRNTLENFDGISKIGKDDIKHEKKSLVL